jgi:hypothetical protein
MIDIFACTNQWDGICRGHEIKRSLWDKLLRRPSDWHHKKPRPPFGTLKTLAQVEAEEQE